MTYLNMFLFMGTCIQPSLRMVELSSMMDSPFNHSTLVKPILSNTGIKKCERKMSEMSICTQIFDFFIDIYKFQRSLSMKAWTIFFTDI